MPKIVRVLSELHLEGKKYQPNAVIQLDDKRAKALEDAGSVDSDPEAVAYCKDKLGAVVVKHELVKSADANDEGGATTGAGSDKTPQA